MNLRIINEMNLNILRKKLRSNVGRQYWIFTFLDNARQLLEMTKQNEMSSLKAKTRQDILFFIAMHLMFSKTDVMTSSMQFKESLVAVFYR